MRIGPEDTQLIILMDWVRFNKLDDFIWHTANERRCSPQHGAILKRKGQKAGVFDITVARASRGYHGMYLEMKSINGKLSESQNKFMANMYKEGYAVKVADRKSVV